MKKVLSVLLSLLLIIAAVPVVQSSAVTEELEPVQYVVTGEYSEDNEKFTVTVTMENNKHGLWSSIFYMSYNTEALSIEYDPYAEEDLLTIKNGNMWSANEAYIDFDVIGADHSSEWARNSVYIYFVGHSTYNVCTMSEGTVFTVTFDVLDYTLSPEISLGLWRDDPNNHIAINEADVEGIIVPFETTYVMPHTVCIPVEFPLIWPTCSEVGYMAGTRCEICGIALSGCEEIAMLEHTEEAIPDVFPTCSSTGVVGAKKCSVCGEITNEGTIVAKLDHVEEAIPDVFPTCSSTGVVGAKKCSVCGEITNEGTIVAKFDHVEETLPAVEATCTESGLSEGKQCTVCGEVTVKQTVIAALGHKSQMVVAKDPTCTEAGNTQGIICPVCNAQVIPFETISATGHNFVDDVCTVCGSLDGVEGFTLMATSEIVDGKLYVYYNLYNNPGIWSITADLSFNTEALELAEVINGSVFADEYYTECPAFNGTHRYFSALEDVENCEGNGLLVTYVFNILDETKNYDIEITVDPDDVFDVDFENKELVITNNVEQGGVIPEFSAGDVTGDGMINSQDLFRVKLIMMTIVEPAATERLAADVNGDGLINSTDVFYLSYRILYGEWI